MFKWFKKTAQAAKGTTGSGVATISESIVHVDGHEFESFKDQGNAYFGSGKLEDAAECYRRAIALNPHYAEAYTNLGYVFQVRGDLEEAIALYRKAVAIKPDLLTAHQNLGFALMSLGQSEAAEESLLRVIALVPEHAAALRSLGVIAAQRGDFLRAETLLRRALELQPDNAEAHSNLGNLLKLGNRLLEAETSYRLALELKPDYAEAYSDLGNVLFLLNRFDGAEVTYRHALQIKPDYAEVHSNLGATLLGMGRLDEAETACRRALEINPDFAMAHSNLGNILKDMNRMDKAETSYRHALQINPGYADAHYNLGLVLYDLNRLDEAEASYRRALQVGPDHAEAYNNLGCVLKRRGQLDEAEACFRRALEIKPDYCAAHSNLIFTLDLMVGVDTATLQEERKRWDAAHAAHLHQRRAHSNIPDPKRRLRVGYVSADFREHSASKVFGGMLTGYDRQQFDVFAYSNYKGRGDGLTELFEQNVTVWRNIIGLSDGAAAEMIREDRIDILIDLSGHMLGNRLLVFARKPAPVQITAWGYAAGTGMRAMDVFFTDPVMVPPQEKQYFAEEVRYLPSVVGSFFNEHFPDVNELPALRGGVVTFGSFNRLAKATEETYRLWAKVLLAVPRSRFILKAGELNDTAARERIIGYFTKAGVAADRIIMLGGTSWHEHMQAYNKIDLALDPFPHGGGVTTLEGLMMGVPVITLRWPTPVGRLSASIVTTLGLSGWIAETRKQYFELAVRKAGELQSLALLRQQLRGIFTSSVIGDQAAYARTVEQEYRRLWQDWCSSIKDASGIARTGLSIMEEALPAPETGDHGKPE